MKGQGQQNSESGGAGLLFLVGGVIVILMIIWYTGHTRITQGVFWLKYQEMHLAKWFTPQALKVQRLTRYINPASLSFSQLIQFANMASRVLLWPVLIIFIIMAFILQKGKTAYHFRKSYTMQLLRAQEVRNWPQIKPVCNLDLIEVHVDEVDHPWRMSITPFQFCKMHKLLIEGVLPDQQGPSFSLDRAKTSQLFLSQMGPLFTNFQDMSHSSRALAAIFMAKKNGDRDAVKKLLIQLALNPHADDGSIAQLLQKYEASMKAIVDKHAYQKTVMATLLEHARMDGILAAAEFLWLKPIDRSMWYMLNTVGRQTSFVEVAGPCAHWLTEKSMGRKMIMPMIDEAIVALELAVSNMLITEV
jgi:intracellular multiplication protein IcmP